MLLSDKFIIDLKPIGKDKKYTDGNGLYLCHRKSGKRIFVFRFQWEQKPQTITIGRWPTVSLSDARTIAQAYTTRIEMGIDPRKTKKETVANVIVKNDNMTKFLEYYLDYLISKAIHVPMNQVYTNLKNVYLDKLLEYKLISPNHNLIVQERGNKV